MVTIEVTGEGSWVEVVADGQPLFAQTLQRGETRTFKASDSIEIYLARPREVSIIANGRVLGTPDLDTYRAVFTPETDELPPPHDRAPGGPEAPEAQLPQP